MSEFVKIKKEVLEDLLKRVTDIEGRVSRLSGPPQAST